MGIALSQQRGQHSVAGNKHSIVLAHTHTAPFVTPGGIVNDRIGKRE